MYEEADLQGVNYPTHEFWIDMPEVNTFCPSVRPSSRPKVVSISTVDISCSRENPPSRATTGASLRLLGMPVHPRKHDRCGGAPAPLALPLADLNWNSMITFWAGYNDGGLAGNAVLTEGVTNRIGINQQGDE